MTSPMTRFTGLIAAPFTPFHDDGRLASDRIALQQRFLQTHAVDGAFICGTTGEGSSLTFSERLEVAEAWLTAAGKDFPVIVNVADTSARSAAELAHHAASHGATAVACTAPYYFRPAGPGELVAYLAEVAAAAPEIPFYFYDIPSTTGVYFPTAEVLRRAATAIPNLAGVKFSNPDLLSLQECVQLDDRRFNVLFGIDEYLLSALVLGADGAVGSTYNFAAPWYARMREHLAAGDLAAAREAQSRSAAMVRILLEFGGIRAGKAMMRMVGVDCGPVRSPLRPMPPQEERSLFQRLQEAVPEVFAEPLRL